MCIISLIITMISVVRSCLSVHVRISIICIRRLITVIRISIVTTIITGIITARKIL